MTELENLARAEKAAYQRAWRARNKDKVRATNQRYWQRRAEKAAAERKGAESNGAD